MSLTTIIQMASCLLWARDTFGMALKHTAHIIIPLPDLGHNMLQENVPIWLTENEAFQKEMLQKWL